MKIYKKNDVVLINLRMGFQALVVIVDHKHSLGMISPFAPKGSLSIHLDVLKRYQDTEIVCSVNDQKYNELLEKFKPQKADQLQLWNSMDAEKWSNYEDIIDSNNAQAN